MLLSDEGKRDFLKSNFHPHFDIQINHIGENITGFINFVLPLELIWEEYDKNKIIGMFNDDFNNVFFTDEQNNLFKYEFYKGMYFIRLYPYSSILRMHIVPKKYDASNTKTNNPILFFRDDKVKPDEYNFECSEQYERRDDGNLINLQYKESDKISSNGLYAFDIRKHTKGIDRLQINMGYSYNDTNPTNEIRHLTGVIDRSNAQGIEINEFTEFNATLLDGNFDNVNENTNVIKSMKFDQGNIEWPEDSAVYALAFDNPHHNNKIYHKTIKYFNDDIYMEEDKKTIFSEWKEAEP